MNKARETILRLVAEGKISVEEAEELLEAIEGASGGPFANFFGGKRAEAGPRARARARRPEGDRQYEHKYDYRFNFPWDQPDWQWPWERHGWQWPWERPDWQWPWERPSDAKSTSMFEVPEEAQLKIRNAGGDLTIRGTDETSLRLSGASAASKVATEDKVVYISSTGTDLAIEVPAKVASMEIAQNGGDMVAQTLNADLVARVAGGDMSISKATGKLQASVEGGDISLADIESTEVGVRTDAGDIFLNMLPAVKEGSISLSSDNGDISLVLPPDSQCEISASAPNGSVSRTLPPESAEIVDETDTYLNVRLNGGGAEIVISAGMGDINIRA